MNKWKLLKRKIVYNSFITLTEDEVLDPNGNKTKRNLIKVKKGSVVIIARDSNNEFYLIGQDRYAVNQYSWEFVSGGIEEGENPKEAAIRELGEELGLVSKQWKSLGSFHPANSLMEREVFVFFADKVEHAKDSDGFEQDEYEKLDIRKVKHKELIKMVSDNEIKDALSLSALMLFSV